MILAITLLAFAAQATPLQEPYPCDYIKQNVWDPKFTPGQKWTYYTRPANAGSTLTIVEVDDVPTVGFVVHIVVEPVTLRVDNINRKTINQPVHGGTQHFAIQRGSLASSVTYLVDNVPIPVLNYSYSTYRAHCVALTYTTTVADTLTLIETIREAKLEAQRCERLAKTMAHPPPPCKPPLPSEDPSPTPVFPSTPMAVPPAPTPPASLQPASTSSPTPHP